MWIICLFACPAICCSCNFSVTNFIRSLQFSKNNLGSLAVQHSPNTCIAIHFATAFSEQCTFIYYTSFHENAANVCTTCSCRFIKSVIRWQKKEPGVERIKENDVQVARVLFFDRTPQSFGYLEVKSHLLNSWYTQSVSGCGETVWCRTSSALSWRLYLSSHTCAEWRREGATVGSVVVAWETRHLFRTAIVTGWCVCVFV